MNPRLLNEIKEIQNMMDLLNESKLADDVIDLHLLNKTGGIDITAKNSEGKDESILKTSSVDSLGKDDKLKSIVIETKPKRFDVDEEVTIRIVGLKADKAKDADGQIPITTDKDKIKFNVSDVIDGSSKGVAMEVDGNVYDGIFLVQVYMDGSTVRDQE